MTASSSHGRIPIAVVYSGASHGWKEQAFPAILRNGVSMKLRIKDFVLGSIKEND
jgi:hypothetical protein